MKRYFFRDVARNFSSHNRLRYAIAVARKLGGVIPRACNLCDYEGRFRAYGHPPRYDAECLRCGSRERQRLFGLLLAAHPELGRGRVVHFAPEAEIVPILRARAETYRTADIAASDCDLRLDMTAIDLPDASVDLFVANHVLEHVDDDAVALAELHRCLASGGTALLSVPIAEGWPRTYEAPDVAFEGSDEARERHFGRFDHVRYYGTDFPERVATAGFDVESFAATGAQTAAYNLLFGDRIFIARKR